MKTILQLLLAAGTLAAQPEPPALRVSLISLGVKDAARSIKFYGETLGLQMTGKPGEVTLFKAGEVTIAVNAPFGRFAGDAIIGAVEIVFPVEGVAAAHAILTKRGCNFIRAPREVTTGMWAATFSDPDGHRLTIVGAK